MHLLKLEIWPFAGLWDIAKSLKCPNCIITFPSLPFYFIFLKAVAVEILESCRNRVSADITMFLYCLDWTRYQELISFHHVVCTKGRIQS